MRIFLKLTLLTFLASACAHYPDVRPAADGIHTVSFLTESKNEGYQAAFSQAKDYCDDVVKKRPAVVSEKSQYVGSMDESTYNAAKTASKVVGAVGAAGAVLGGKNERQVGGVATVGGGIASGALGQGYEYTLKFKCE